MTKGILVDVNKCIGCWTCSMACKTAHHLDTDVFWQYVRTIGGGERDEPGGEWPNLYMKWMPIWKTKCPECSGDAMSDNLPYCVYNCPTHALVYGDVDDPDSAYSKRLAELKSKQFRVYKIPEWEETRETVTYAEKNI